MSYFKQLDGLRAIAVLMVVCYHWLPGVEFFHFFSIGPLGVSIFFVLSGFLITRILLDKKKEFSANNSSVIGSLKTFYTRRFFRIFPIYYLFLLFLVGLNFETIRSEILYHGLYISNLLYVLNGEFSNGLSHLWSLSVEEQFYIIWPLALFWVPVEKLKLFFISSIIFGIIALLILANTVSLGGLLVFAKIDAFAWGGLLALLSNQGKLNHVTQKWPLFLCLFIGFISLHFYSIGIFQPLKDSLSYLIFFYVIAKLITTENFIIRAFFENKLLVYIGRISYGIYLYHNVMQWLLPYFTEQLGIPFPPKEQELVRFLIYLTTTLIIASLSWYLIEKPLVKIKNKYS